ncbi:peptidase domain-containing ABC transporter [Pseudomonas syringae]|uniref:peptidase domain-containing ABC transporter n=1 Tax=Pseudomonas syringae TaxID=317 RepID=UPI003F84646F
MQKNSKLSNLSNLSSDCDDSQIDWCLDYMVAHYSHISSRCDNDLYTNRDDSLKAKATRRSLSAQPRSVNVDQLSSLSIPAVLERRDGTYFIMVGRSREGAVFISDNNSGASCIGWEDVALVYSGTVILVAPLVSLTKPSKSGGKFSKLTGDLGNVVGPSLHIGIQALGIEACLIIAPFFLKLVIDRILPSGDALLLVTATGFFFFVAALQILLLDIRSRALIQFAQQVNLNWLKNLFNHLVRLPSMFFEQRSVGDVAAKFWSVAHVQRTLAVGFIEGALDGLMAVLTIFLLSFIEPRLVAMPIIAVIIYCWQRWRCLKKQREAEHKRSKFSVSQQAHIWENISGIQSIKVFQKENRRLDDWLDQVNELFDADNKYQSIEANLRTWLVALMSVERVGVVSMGTWMTTQQDLTLAQLILFCSYNELFLSRATFLINKVAEILLLDGHINKISDITMQDAECVATDFKLEGITQESATIEFLNVSFRHADSRHSILENFNLKVKSGECIAFTGPSGCGKTTLLKLMLGLSVPQSGEILVAGHNLNTIAPDSYRSHIATVTQEDRLFSGSVFENITFFDDFPSVDDVLDVIHMVELYEDIQRMPNGLHTQIKDSGSLLSSGQRQRILLARALYRRPKFLFLDEATSHLDSMREKKISEKLSALKVTRIVVSHGTVPLTFADRVFSYQNGQFVQTFPIIREYIPRTI